jgi:S-methylmethionine-dependent homocysteine/selenocysteine methylase
MVFLDLQKTKEIRTVYRDGFDAGSIAMTLQYREDVEEQRQKAEEEKKAFEERAATLLAQARADARTQKARADRAIAELVQNDVTFATCEAQYLPDTVRRHHPVLMLDDGI